MLSTDPKRSGEAGVRSTEQFVGNKVRGFCPDFHEYSKDVLIFYGIIRGPASGSPYGDTVDFDIAIQLDDEALSAVDQLRVDEIRALRIDLDDHIRCLDLKAAGIVDIVIMREVDSPAVASKHWSRAHAVIGYTRHAWQNGLYFIFIQYHRFGIFFMFLGNLIHFLVVFFTVSISQVSPNVSSTRDWKVSF